MKTEAQAAAENPGSDGQWAVLAAVRFLLAFIILIDHAGPWVGIPDWLYSLETCVGHPAAMIGFFLISGYSICHSVQRPEGFYRRRLTRIYPLYITSIVIAAIPFLLFGFAFETRSSIIHAPRTVWPFIGHALFLQGVASDWIMTNTALWSLSVEVIYYLFAPLFHRQKSRVLLIFTAASTAAYLGRNALGLKISPHGAHGETAALLLWCWLLGFLAYRHRQERWMQILLIVGATALLPLYQPGSNPEFGAGLICAVCFAILFSPPALNARFAKVALYLGDVSYPLYVLHFPLMLLLTVGLPWLPWWSVLAGIIAGAVLLLHGVDYPYRRYQKAKAVHAANRRAREHLAVHSSNIS
ncbi:MAG: acyltransferase 3 [Capsulimonas sp.]|nr:acyltransferase 3 [Capsulimonas sp.]